MEQFLEYLAMDGYAIYVWPALAIAAIVITAMTVWSVMGLRASDRRLQALQPIVERRRAERRAQREAIKAGANADTVDSSGPPRGGETAS